MGKEKRKATIFDIARFYKGHKCGRECEKCEISSYNNGKGIFCTDFILKHPDVTNEIILKWCDEHPVKTRQSEFLKLFPDALLGTDGPLIILPCQFDKKYKELHGCCGDCDKCRKAYWNEEIEG